MTAPEVTNALDAGYQSLRRDMCRQADEQTFCTYRILNDRHEVLRLGFIAAMPRFAPDPEDAAEFPDHLTARDVAMRLASRMKERLAVAGVHADPPALDTEQRAWTGGGLDWWGAMQRFDRTSIETGRFKATVLPRAFRETGVRS